jgi:hypothetical protein
MTLRELKTWHETKTGLLVFGLAELLIAYIFASLAIDSGSLWFYLLTLIFAVGAAQNLFKLVVKIIHGNKSKAK